MAERRKRFSSIGYAPIHGLPAKGRKFLGAGWHTEAISIVASVLCTGAVIAILARMNNSPLAHWTLSFRTYSITLNATIAALITAAQSSAMLSVASCLSQSKWLHFKKSARKLRELDMFEDASGGPWGSLLLLGLLRMRVGYIAAIGAVATIVALGFDVSAQQLVELDSRAVEVDHNAAFGLNYFYDGGTKSDAGHGSVFYPQTSTADVGMQGAIYKGIFNIDTTPVFRCNSTCVWPGSYVTLGFSSNCSDATSMTSVNQSSHSYYLTTPHDISITANYSVTDYQTVINVVADDLTLTLDHGLEDNFLVPAEIVRVAIVKAPVTDHSSNIIDRNKLQVFECTVGFSAYNYTNVSASGGRFVIKHQNPIALDPGIYSYETGTGVVTFNQTGLPVLKARAPDMGAIAQFFTSDRFSGAIYDGESVPTDPRGIGVALLNANVSEAFRNMAQSMTDQLRSRYNGTASGSTMNSIPFVQVRWIWLVVPLFVQAASALLLALTWSTSRTHHVKLWKSSIVAVLYHDLVLEGDAAGTVRTDVRSPEEMEDLAKQTKAVLE